MPDDPLAGLWAKTEAPARDPGFELAVEEAVARRQLAQDLVWVTVVVAVIALIGWLAGPELSVVLGDAASPLAAAGPVTAVALAMALLAWWLARATEETER